MKEVGRATQWPALGFEEHPWQIAEPHEWSRNVRKRHRGPYRSAIPAEIAAVSTSSLDPETMALADDASAEAVRFDAEFGVDLFPFASLLLRSESAASSKIENLTASARSIALAELGERKKLNARLIVANVAAMRAAVGLVEQIDGATIIEMHRALLEDSEPEIVGDWRDKQNWIGGEDAGPHQALFIPPHHERVPAAMDDLLRFIDREDIAVLPHVALAHAQFETVHPFPDGNGRTGRALMHAMLVKKGLVRHVTIPVSAGILTDIDAYFAALTSYRAGEPNKIVELVANSVLAGILNGRKLASNLRAQHNKWASQITARSDSTVWPLLDLILRHPVISSALVESELSVTPKTALDAIETLVDTGILAQIGNGKRGRKWQALAVLSELDAFAQRAGRRRSV